MKRLIVPLLLSLAIAASAFAQPKPLLRDPELNNFRGDWTFYGNAYSNPYGFCGDPYYAKFVGGYGTVSQAVTAIGLQKFQFQYTVSVVNAGYNPWSSLEINIYDANTMEFLAHVDSVPPSVPQACVTRTIDLGTHVDWRFRNLLVRFEGYSYNYVEFRMEYAQLTQYTDPLP